MEKKHEDFASKLTFLGMVPQQKTKHQFFSNKHDQILFKLNLMGIIFTIKHCTSKERCNVGWGGARPFFY
jgi:hypothetical protein